MAKDLNIIWLSANDSAMVDGVDELRQRIYVILSLSKGDINFGSGNEVNLKELLNYETIQRDGDTATLEKLRDAISKSDPRLSLDVTKSNITITTENNKYQLHLTIKDNEEQEVVIDDVVEIIQLEEGCKVKFKSFPLC